MKEQKMVLDSDIEIVILLMWFLPVVVMMNLLIIGLLHNCFWMGILLVMIGWIIIWGCVYWAFHGTVIVKDDSLLIEQKSKVIAIKWDDIRELAIEHKANFPSGIYRIKIYLNKQLINGKPFVVIKNKEFHRKICLIEKQIYVKHLYIMD